MHNKQGPGLRFLPRAVAILTSCFLLCLAISPVVAGGPEGGSVGKSGKSTNGEDEVLLASAENLADHVVISEIYYNPEDEYDSEYIEFYNPTGSAVDLSSWSFSDDGGSSWVNFSEDTDEQNTLTIPAHGFLLLVDGGWSTGKDDSSWPGGDVVDEMSITNGGGTVKIRDTSGDVVDSVTYEGDADDGQAMERKASASSTKSSMRGSGSDADRGNGYDTDSFNEDFVGPLPPEPQNTSSTIEPYESFDNQAPVADPGGPYACDVDETIQLDGSGSSDPDGTVESYEWDFDEDGQYDDATGATPSFSCDSSGTVEINLKITDDAGATDTADTSVSITGELNVSVVDPSLPADGTSTTTVIVEYEKGAEISLSTQFGELSQNSLTIGGDGTAEVTLTSPSNPTPSSIKATAGEEVAVTTIFFQKEDTSPIETAKTRLIASGEGKGMVDWREEIGVVARPNKLDGSLDQEVALAVARYSGNPRGKEPMESQGMFIDAYVDQPTSLKRLTLELYLDQWPEEPEVKFWSSSKGKWLSCSDLQENSSAGYLKVTINSSSNPSLDELSGLPLVAGGEGTDSSREFVSKEIEITKPGWNMVSIPVKPKEGSPAATFKGVSPSKIIRWDPGKDGGHGGYKSSDEGFSLKTCQGNWIFLSETEVPKTFTVTGEFNEKREIVLTEEGWHQFGVPAETSIDSIGVRKEEGGKVVSITQAADEGWLSRFLWEWDPEKEIYYAYEFGVNEKSVEVGKGYWIRTDRQNMRLVIPYTTPPSPPSGVYPKSMLGIPLTGTEAEERKIPTPPPPPVLQSFTSLSVVASPNPVTNEEWVELWVRKPEVEALRVKAYDLAGREVFSSDFRSGDSLKWNLTAQGGERLANGMYLYQIEARDSTNRTMIKVGKLLVLR